MLIEKHNFGLLKYLKLELKILIEVTEYNFSVSNQELHMNDRNVRLN